MIKYIETKLGITKDGHTMFRFDIVQDLNRKSYLEDLTVEQQQEITKLKQLAKTKNARTLERIGRIEQQEREIAEQKSLAAYAEQRANIAEKANDALVLKNASLNSQAVNQVGLHNDVVVENNEAMAEAKETALFLYETHYKNDPDSVPFELLETLSGVISQIDNMISGLSRTKSLQSVKADAIDEAAKWLSPETPAGEEGCELLRQYANEIREGKS